MSKRLVENCDRESSVIFKVVKELHSTIEMSCFLFRKKNSALKLSTHDHAPANLYVRAHTSGKIEMKKINETIRTGTK